MLKKVIIYWRDIPSQVLVQKGRVRKKAPLSLRFIEAIDRAAMRAGKGTSDAYIAEWRRETTKVKSDDDMQALADREAAELEARYSKDDLLILIRNKGFSLAGDEEDE